MGKLNEAIIYLSGPMENSLDNGATWRKEFIQQVKNSGLKIYMIDPTDKPGTNVGNQEDRFYQLQLRNEGRYEELSSFVKQYRRVDLRFCDIADAIVVFIDPKISSWGTCNEIYVGESQRKPMFVVCEGGIKNLPNFGFDIFDINLVFESKEELIDYLIKLDNGEIHLGDKWILFRQELKRLKYWD